jgi:pyruvate dehydrogenase E1 component alpha subunit
MLLIRLLEDRLQALCNEGKAGDLHFNKGQEAIAVGVCAALRDTDYLVTHHRTIAHAIAKGVPLRPLVAELLGKAEGMNGGRAGEMHLSYLPKRFMFSWQLVGTCVPVAAGIAWAVKHYHKTDDVVVVFHGDAATANAQFHEGLNLAAVQRVPLLLVCENNHVAGNVRQDKYLPVARVGERAAAYGIGTAWVDGNKVGAVAAAAELAVAYVREKQRPFLLECDTTRLGKHKQGMGDLRGPEEMAALALRDPLRNVAFAPEVKEAFEAEIDGILAEMGVTSGSAH